MRFQFLQVAGVLVMSFVLAGAAPPVVAGDPDPYVFSLDEVSGYVNCTATVTVSLDSASGDDLGGYSIAVCHDADLVSIEVGDVAKGEAVADAGFLFHVLTIIDDEGWTVGTALSLGEPFETADDQEMYLATYELLEIGEAVIEFCEIGDPQVSTTVVRDSDLMEISIGEGLTGVNGGISITELVLPQFVRGDCNDDGAVTLADGVRTVAVVFNDATVSCAEACNVDNVGKTNVMDALTLFNFLFLEASPPPAPFPECGIDEGAECEPVDGDCESSSC